MKMQVSTLATETTILLVELFTALIWQCHSSSISTKTIPTPTYCKVSGLTPVATIGCPFLMMEVGSMLDTPIRLTLCPSKWLSALRTSMVYTKENVTLGKRFGMKNLVDGSPLPTMDNGSEQFTMIQQVVCVLFWKRRSKNDSRKP